MIVLLSDLVFFLIFLTTHSWSKRPHRHREALPVKHFFHVRSVAQEHPRAVAFFVHPPLLHQRFFPQFLKALADVEELTTNGKYLVTAKHTANLQTF